MKRLLAFFLAIWSVAASAAIGDLGSFRIGTEGWSAYTEWRGFVTNCVNAFGLGTNNSLTGTEKIKLTVSSSGFDDTGTSNWTTRTIYGTTNVYFAYPSDAFKDQSRNDAADATANGAIVTNRIALSEYLYQGDTATVTVLANTYSNNNAATAFTVNNGSLMASPKPVGCWLTTPYNLISSSTMKLRAVAFHRDGTLGRPVRVMRFVVRDQNSHAVTNFVTSMSRLVLPLTGISASIYEADVDISSMTQADQLRCDFTAYPWFGTNTLDTMDGVNLVGPYYAPITNVCDRLGTYGRAYAIVSSDAANNAGVVSSNAATTWQTPFRDQNVCQNAIALSNAIWYGSSRSNHANSFIYVASSNYSFFGNGANTSFGNKNPPVWITMAPYPTNIYWTVALTNCGTGIDNHCRRYKLVDLNIASVSASAGLYGTWDALWLTNCMFDLRPPLCTGTFTNCWLTSCMMSNIASSGFLTQGDNTSTLLLDILDITTNGYVAKPPNKIGERRTNAMTATAVGQMIAWETPPARVVGYNMGVCAYNDFRGWQGTTVPINCYDAMTCTNGYAFVGNLCEMFAGNINIASFNSGTGFECTNGIRWGNMFLGNRVLMDYNWNGTLTRHRVLMSTKDNYYDWVSIKSDTTAAFVTAQTGNWATVYGVARSDEINVGATNRFNTPTSHSAKFAGMYSLDQYYLLTNALRFVNLQSLQAANGAGMGDYSVPSTSLSILPSFNNQWPLPFSLYGIPNGGYGPVGCIGQSSPRKGDFIGL